MRIRTVLITGNCVGVDKTQTPPEVRIRTPSIVLSLNFFFFTMCRLLLILFRNGKYSTSFSREHPLIRDNIDMVILNSLPRPASCALRGLHTYCDAFFYSYSSDFGVQCVSHLSERCISLRSFCIVTHPSTGLVSNVSYRFRIATRLVSLSFICVRTLPFQPPSIHARLDISGLKTLANHVLQYENRRKKLFVHQKYSKSKSWPETLDNHEPEKLFRTGK